MLLQCQWYRDAGVNQVRKLWTFSSWHLASPPQGLCPPLLQGQTRVNRWFSIQATMPETRFFYKAIVLLPLPKKWRLGKET